MEGPERGPTLEIVIAAIVGVLAGIGGGYALRSLLAGRGVNAAKNSATQIIADAEEEKKRILLEAKEEALKNRESIEGELRDRRREVQRTESRLVSREENLDKRQDALELRENRVVDREKDAETAVAEAEALKQEQSRKLEAIAALTMTEARDQIMQQAEGEMEHELAKR
ncbi:MAG: Rnase Y domain-containing protein, partial [Dehalococcoidia bacterium]